MRFLLDSNIVIFILKADNATLVSRMALADEDDLAISAVTYAEVAHGSMRGKPPAMAVLERFLDAVPVLPFDAHAARAYATIPFRRGGYDRLIAAHALALGLTLVTDNEADFADVPGLRVENWTVCPSSHCR